MSMEVGAGEFSIQFDPQTSRIRFVDKGRTIAQSPQTPQFRLGGEAVAIGSISEDGGLDASHCKGKMSKGVVGFIPSMAQSPVSWNWQARITQSMC